MKQHLSKIIIGLVLILAAVILYSAVREVRTARTWVGFQLEQYKRNGAIIGSRSAEVHLTADQFNLVNLKLAGTAKVAVAPSASQGADGNFVYPGGEPQQTLALKNVVLFLNHAQPKPTDPGSIGSYLEQGRSDAIPLTRTPLRAEVAGAGKFTWQAESDRSPFWYPFDRYTLHVNPALVVPGQDEQGREYGAYEYIEAMGVELGVPNLRMRVIPLQPANRDADRYEIEVSRPYVLRWLTGLIGALAVGWLVYLAWLADPDSYVVNILSFFVGLWGIRKTLLGDLAVFPVMLDYAVITLSVIAVGIVIAKRAQAQVIKNKMACPYCKSQIPQGASRCPNCTAHLV